MYHQPPDTGVLPPYPFLVALLTSNSIHDNNTLSNVRSPPLFLPDTTLYEVSFPSEHDNDVRGLWPRATQPDVGQKIGECEYQHQHLMYV